MPFTEWTEPDPPELRRPEDDFTVNANREDLTLKFELLEPDKPSKRLVYG